MKYLTTLALVILFFGGTACCKKNPVKPEPEEPLLWTQTLDFDHRDEASGVGVAPDGSIVVGGKDWDGAYGSEPTGALAGFAPDGTLVWTKLLNGSSWVRSNLTYHNGEFFFSGSNGLSFTQVLFGAVTPSGTVTLDPIAHGFDGAEGTVVRIADGRAFVGFIANDGSHVAERTLSGEPIRNIPLNRHRVYGLVIGSNYLLTSGDSHHSDGMLVGFVQKRALDGVLIWERSVSTGLLRTHIVEQDGTIYVGGTLHTGTTQTLLVAAFDQSGNELWRTTWDGGQPGSISNWLNQLIPNPNGGVVAIGNIQELPGNPNCTTMPNCWDAAIWIVGPNGETVWEKRADFFGSPWDIFYDATFDDNGDFIAVGTTTPNPTGSDVTDDVDMLVTKWRLPH